MPPASDPDPEDVPTILDALASGHARLAGDLAGVAASWLQEPSALRGWTRLNIVCHLRYVALAMIRMTEAIQHGDEQAVYPLGRDVDRPASLHPAVGERPGAVASDLARVSQRLDELWRDLPMDTWQRRIREPDHGELRFSRWLALRWTEVEVHRADLGHLPRPAHQHWSNDLVAIVLPLRVAWLTQARRRADADLAVGGTWRLTSPRRSWTVTARPGSTAVGFDAAEHFPIEIAGTEPELLAVLLGRSGSPNRVTAAFKAAFPGP